MRIILNFLYIRCTRENLYVGTSDSRMLFCGDLNQAGENLQLRKLESCIIKFMKIRPSIKVV